MQRIYSRKSVVINFMVNKAFCEYDRYVGDQHVVYEFHLSFSVAENKSLVKLAVVFKVYNHKTIISRLIKDLIIYLVL